MDHFVEERSSFTIPVLNSPRFYPHTAPLSHVGYIPYKTGMQHFAFLSFNFSLILRGSGLYCYGDSHEYEVSAPCVITQWPGEKFYYGSTDEDGWEELYLIYHPNCMECFKKMGFISEQRRWWRVSNKVSFHRLYEELLHQAEEHTRPGTADQLDRLAEQAVLQSLLPETPIPDRKGLAVLAIKELVDGNPREEYDFHRLGESHGLSVSVFRRSWNQYVGVPPQRYLIEKRMELARQMLLETSLQIKEIAWQLGYEDEFYFSRLFRKFTGMSAKTYRCSVS